MLRIAMLAAAAALAGCSTVQDLVVDHEPDATLTAIENARLRECPPGRTLENAPDPARGVRDYAEAAAAIMRESDYTFGCPVAPVILDATADLPELAALCKEAFETWMGIMRRAFVEAGASPARAESIALLALSSIEGMLLVARAYRDCGPMLKATAELEAAMRGHVLEQAELMGTYQKRK